MYICVFKNDKKMKDLQRTEIERQMTEMGLDFDFSGISETNGLSIYYTVNGEKYRFSNHSVRNYDRIMNEKHFGLPYYSVFSMKNGVSSFLKNVFTKEIIKNL